MLYTQKAASDAAAIGALIGKAQERLDTHDRLEALMASMEALHEMQKRGVENPKYLKQLQSIISNVGDFVTLPFSYDD